MMLRDDLETSMEIHVSDSVVHAHILHVNTDNS